MEDEVKVSQAKQDCIVDLHTIRGGLSLISKKIREIWDIEYNISNLETKALNVDKEIKDLEDKEAELEASRLIYNAAAKRLEDTKCATRKSSKSSAHERNVFIGKRVAQAKEDAKDLFTYRNLIEKKYFFINLVICSIITAFILIATGLPDYMFEDSRASAVGWVIVISPISGVIFAGIFQFFTPLLYVFPIITMIKDRKAYVRDEYLKALQEIEERQTQSDPEYKIAVAEKKLKQAEVEIKNAELVARVSREKIERLKIAKIQIQKDREVEREKLEYISKMIENLEEALYDRYNNKVNKSDWKNIDLLLYYLKTNRADTLKEALQLMDKQRQTDEIVKAIGEATQSIQDTIHTTMREMSEALIQSFSVISNQLSQISKNQNTIIAATGRLTDSIGTLTSKVSDGFSSQVSATELSNALLEKANESSKRLCDELKNCRRLSLK